MLLHIGVQCRKWRNPSCFCVPSLFSCWLPRPQLPHRWAASALILAVCKSTEPSSTLCCLQRPYWITVGIAYYTVCTNLTESSPSSPSSPSTPTCRIMTDIAYYYIVYTNLTESWPASPSTTLSTPLDLKSSLDHGVRKQRMLHAVLHVTNYRPCLIVMLWVPLCLSTHVLRHCGTCSLYFRASVGFDARTEAMGLLLLCRATIMYNVTEIPIYYW
jgi:hypothetical protein